MLLCCLDDTTVATSAMSGAGEKKSSAGEMTDDEATSTTKAAHVADAAATTTISSRSHGRLTGKKGAAFVFAAENSPKNSWRENLPKVLALKPSWNYNWGTARLAAQPDDIEFVPMLWTGHRLDKMQELIATDIVPQGQSGLVRFVLGFNEPDEKSQSNMTVELALERWSVLEAYIPHDVLLVSPSCAHPTAAWMQSFMQHVTATRKRVDWIGVHWYGGANFNAFCTQMRKMYDAYGQRPILITEFAPADWKAKTCDQNRFSVAAVLAFMKQALPWLESQDWIAGYAWFSFDIDRPCGTSSALFDKQGQLTACGRYYASVSAATPLGDQSIVA